MSNEENVVRLITLTMLLVLTGCSGADDNASTPTSTAVLDEKEHMLQGQQDTLEKSKEVAAALEEAMRQSEDALEQAQKK